MVNTHDLIAAGIGLLCGGLIIGVLVWLWARSRCKSQLGAAESQRLHLEEKLMAQAEALLELQARIDRIQEGSDRHQARAGTLDVTVASLEAEVRRIPPLEQELAHHKKQVAALQQDLRQESAALAQAREKGLQLERIEADNTRKQDQLDAHNAQTAQMKAQIAELATLLDEERRQNDEKIALLNEARDRLKIEFQHLAQKIFQEKSETFAEQNKNNIDHLINPLREQIGEFKKRVEDVYDKESRDRAALQSEIHHLKELNQRISKEALNLTRALKGDSKARGNWGEVILERVLETSGLQKGREYEVQVSLRDGQGRRYQPDAIVRLPQGKDVVVDAKLSLKAYEAYYTAEDAEAKDRHLKSHIDAMRTHIKALTAKHYDELEGVRSLDFVLMFVPIEAAFLTAAEKDRDLFSEAFEKNIMIVSPSTLLVTLRTIENIWRNEYQNRYALEIAQKAGGLYDKFVGFVEALEEVGQQLDRARGAYQMAHDRLVNGRGNLIRRTQVLKTLGVKAGKELPREMIEMAEADAPCESSDPSDVEAMPAETEE
jgi:DNA recombination protein RmuC